MDLTRSPYHTVQEVAEYLAVSDTLVYDLIRRGDLEAQKIGARRYRIAGPALERYLASTRSGGLATDGQAAAQ